jgi:hypothetical protein
LIGAKSRKAWFSKIWSAEKTETLVARMFKEKYYLEASFLTSNLERRPSYAWRSI